MAKHRRRRRSAPLRIRHHATLVGPDGVSYSQVAAAWDAYLEAAVAVVPDVLASLLIPEAVNAVGQDRDALISHIDKWATRWGFIQHAVRVQAESTLNLAKRRASQGGIPPDGFVCDSFGTPYPEYGDCMGVSFRPRLLDDDGHPFPVSPVEPHRFPELAGRVSRPFVAFMGTGLDRAVFRQYMELYGGGAQVLPELPMFFWEPSVETKAEALHRVLETFTTLLRADLDTIEAAYRAHDYRVVPEKRAYEHFEWLARVRLLRESHRSIARSLIAGRRARDPEFIGDESIYTSHVGNMIDELTKLLGLDPPK